MSSQNSNDIKEFSLLAPDRNGKYFTISGNTSNDLSVDFIVESLTRNSAEKSAISNILCNMPVDKAIIGYRSAIYSEIRISSAPGSENFIFRLKKDSEP